MVFHVEEIKLNLREDLHGKIVVAGQVARRERLDRLDGGLTLLRREATRGRENDAGLEDDAGADHVAIIL